LRCPECNRIIDHMLSTIYVCGYCNDTYTTKTGKPVVVGGKKFKNGGKRKAT